MGNLIFWAKTNSSTTYHPLTLHLIDVAVCAEGIIEREPTSTKDALAGIFGLPWKDARPWLLFLIACHDLGKASPGFQCKWKNLSGLDPGRRPDIHINHAFISQIAVKEFLLQKGWSEELAKLSSEAVGCHHGERIKPSALDDLRGNRHALGDDSWRQARHDLMETLYALFNPKEPPPKDTLTGPEFMLLSGLTSFSDWIGSNEEFFQFGSPEDLTDLQAWWDKRLALAKLALDAIGWAHRKPLTERKLEFQEIFGFVPRPLQTTVADRLSALDKPGVLLIEAPMGEGKTEAALFAHVELQRRFGHRGLYVALPTRATGNAMFARTLTFLKHFSADRELDLQLLHGAAMLNDAYQRIRITDIHDNTEGGGVGVAQWFTHKKRALLSEYGVGTVDQALVPILPVRHNFVRLWGLANRVVIFDEVHAYDAYTGTLLVEL